MNISLTIAPEYSTFTADSIHSLKFMMKYLLFALALLIMSCPIQGQVFDFYNTIYYVASDETSVPGTVLVNSGTNLSGFDYNSASVDHPIFHNGIFFPVLDCGNHNLWVRLQHIAADPNGTENGYNIPYSMNSPFLPVGSTDRIGGWYGFLYEFEIYQDEVLTGVRSDVLGNYYPTGITVASLETLYNDGGILYEWLAFEIMNIESSGWYLNSTNFTGINPNSNPGFSDSLYYATTGTSISAPIGFSTDFPYGADSVYAVDMNLSNAYHSEFKMSASGVSRFRYGYEFTSGGYQGMSMEFGVPPVANIDVTPSCGDSNGSISLEVTGTEPLTYSWSNGNTTASASNLGEGNYDITITDGNGCTITQSAYIYQFNAFDVEINATEIEGDLIFDAILTGGVEDFIYEWNTGSTTSSTSLSLDSTLQMIMVEVTDGNGCVATAEYYIIGVEEMADHGHILVSPNPTSDFIHFNFNVPATELRITNSLGQIIHDLKINEGVKQMQIDLSNQPDGFYLFQLMHDARVLGKGMFIKSR